MKQLKARASKRVSKLRAGISGTSTVSLPQQASTRSSKKYNAESALHTSTPVKSTAEERPALKSAGRLASQKSTSSAPDLQVHSKMQSMQDGDGSENKMSGRIQLASPVTTSPMSSRSRSGMSSSPDKYNQDTSDGLLWCKKTNIVTYQRKHAAGRMPTRNVLQSELSSTTHSSNSDVSNRNTRVRPRKIKEIPAGSRSETGSELSDGEDTEFGSGRSEKSVRKQHDVAVQVDSQSSQSSPRALRHSNLNSASSSLATSPLRSRTKAVMESCSSGKTMVTAKSSLQSGTCFETTSSQPQVVDDMDEEELDQLARLAHGSPQSAVVQISSDETVTGGTPKKLHGSRVKRHYSTPAEQLQHLSTLSEEHPKTVRTQHTDAVVDDVSDGLLDSDKASAGKKRRTETNKKEEKGHTSTSSRATCQLAADGDNKSVKSASSRINVAAAASLQHHSRVHHSTCIRETVSSSRVENSAVEPVAGPSGTARRAQSGKDATEEKSHASG